MLKVLKTILRVFLIIITSLTITALVITVPITRIAFNQKEVVKLLDNSNIYKNLDQAIKESIIEDLNKELEDVPKDIRKEIDVEKLINSIDTSDLLRNLTNGAINIVYSVTDTKLKLTDIVNKYVSEFDEYIVKNDIGLDEETINDIHKTLTEDSLDEVFDDEETNEALKDIRKTVEDIKAYAIIIEAVITILIVISAGIILLLASNKTLSMVTLLAIPTAILLLIELTLSALIKAGREEMGELIYGIAYSIKKSMFDHINIAIAIFILTIIGLIVFKVIRKKQKEKEETKKEA